MTHLGRAPAIDCSSSPGMAYRDAATPVRAHSDLLGRRTHACIVALHVVHPEAVWQASVFYALVQKPQLTDRTTPPSAP
jgi:hypothetical protein